MSSTTLTTKTATEALRRLRMLDASWPKDRFVPQDEIRSRIDHTKDICTTSDARQLATLLAEPESSELIRLALRHNNLGTSLTSHNERVVARLMADEQASFDNFSESGLTERQREAIVTDAPVTLVVAGAGTGKTTTIVAKIDYLVRRGMAKPQEILVLAYNKQAQLELKARIENLAHGHQVRAMTFHAFGYSVVRHKTDPQPEPVTDSAPRSFVHREINQIRQQETLGSPLRKALDSFRADLATPEKTTTFISNVLSFLNRYKTRRATIGGLRRSVRTQRQLDFIVLFEHLVASYNTHLEQTNRIDFSDMIVRSTDLIDSGAHIPRYRYILIDEFQDITQARWRLIQSIRKHNENIKLFLVGDDWQSIYAFDDADVSIMTELQSQERGVARIDLDTTFRFPQPLADVTSQFIMRNPKQLKKSIESANSADEGTPVVIHRYKESEGDRSRRAILIRILTSIAEKRPGSTVLMLGRYNKTVPDNWGELVFLAQSLGLQIKYHTCHSAKGLEADEVIVLDVNGGAMGFPCHLADDEFLQLLPSPSEAFIDAEERRLFYVAVTRTKSVVHLLVDDGNPSIFLEDFETNPAPKSKSRKDRQPAERLEIPFDRLGRVPHCPSCNQPTFIKRVGAKGTFWGCSDFPKCWGRPKKCRSCGESALVLDGPQGNRYCAECGASG